jgi:hypothetical protein
MYVISCPRRLYATVSFLSIQLHCQYLPIHCTMAEPSSVDCWARFYNKWFVNVAGFHCGNTPHTHTRCLQIQPSFWIGALWFVSIWVAGGGGTLLECLLEKCPGHPVAELCSAFIPATSATVTMSADNIVTLTDTASALCTLTFRHRASSI